MRGKPIHRRTFIGQTATVGASLAVSSVAAVAGTPATPARRIKVGVIGALGVGGLTLPRLLRAEAAAGVTGRPQFPVGGDANPLRDII